MKKIIWEIEEIAYLKKRNSRGRRNLSPEQDQSHRNEIGMVAETKQKGQTLGAGRERKTRVKEKKSFLNPKTQGNWKAAGNPRVTPFIPSISICHVATFHTAPPSLINFETKPQASQTTQGKKLFTFCGPHDMSLTTTEPGGQLMGLTRTSYLDEVNVETRWPLDDEQAINDEERKVIQWCQQVIWAVTKPAEQTVGA